MLGIGKHLNVRLTQRRSDRHRRKESDAIIGIIVLQDQRQIGLGLDNRLRLRPIARNSVLKILDPLPVIADADQLLRHSLRNQVVTLRNLFFLHKPRGLSATFSLPLYHLVPHTPVCKSIEGRVPDLENARMLR